MKTVSPGMLFECGVTESVQRRVNEVLDYMDLTRVKHRVIPERPSTRGEIGGELRRLIIAVEIINLPSIVVLDDPARGLEPAVALHLFNRLKFLADSGYTVITAVPQVSHQVYKLFNKTVLLSRGYSVYAGDSSAIKEYFTSPQLGYRYLESRNPVDFLLDVSSGIERPRGQRDAADAEILQKMFESSTYCDQSTVDTTSSPSGDASYVGISKVNILPTTSVPYYGYRFNGFTVSMYRFLVVLQRALRVKLQEKEVLKKSFAANVIVPLFIGYFGYQTGDIGDFCLNLFTFPYPDTANSTSILFLSAAFVFVSQVLNVHIICQKLRVFRYEQKAGLSPSAGFWLATVVSELLFAIIFASLFALIFYFMTDLGSVPNFAFFLSVQLCVAMVGTCSVIMLSAVFRTEIVVRDIFLTFTFLMLFLAGFVFTLPTVRSEIRDISAINPLRWAFEALMAWKFSNYEDGQIYLQNYEFQSFQKDKVFEIMFNFIFFSLSVFFLALLPSPNTLRRSTAPLRERSSTDMSADDEDDKTAVPAASSLSVPRTNSKRSHGSHTPAAPLLFLRESSVTGKKSTITSQHSVSGVEGEFDVRGPTVVFKDVTYRVKDRASPMGYKEILHSVSGQFDWGKFGVIMGATNSGKSTLLQVLAGLPVASTTQSSGSVLLNRKPYDRSLLPWRLCGYVANADEHHRDLSVSEVVSYAMMLRSLEMDTEERIAENVKNALELLQLTRYFISTRAFACCCV